MKQKWAQGWWQSPLAMPETCTEKPNPSERRHMSRVCRAQAVSCTGARTAAPHRWRQRPLRTAAGLSAPAFLFIQCLHHLAVGAGHPINTPFFFVGIKYPQHSPPPNCSVQSTRVQALGAEEFSFGFATVWWVKLGLNQCLAVILGFFFAHSLTDSADH